MKLLNRKYWIRNGTLDPMMHTAIANHLTSVDMTVYSPVMKATTVPPRERQSSFLLYTMALLKTVSLASMAEIKMNMTVREVETAAASARMKTLNASRPLSMAWPPSRLLSRLDFIGSGRSGEFWKLHKGDGSGGLASVPLGVKPPGNVKAAAKVTVARRVATTERALAWPLRSALGLSRGVSWLVE